MFLFLDHQMSRLKCRERGNAWFEEKVLFSLHTKAQMNPEFWFSFISSCFSYPVALNLFHTNSPQLRLFVFSENRCSSSRFQLPQAEFSEFSASRAQAEQLVSQLEMITIFLLAWHIQTPRTRPEAKGSLLIAMFSWYRLLLFYCPHSHKKKVWESKKKLTEDNKLSCSIWIKPLNHSRGPDYNTSTTDVILFLNICRHYKFFIFIYFIINHKRQISLCNSGVMNKQRATTKQWLITAFG